LVTKFLPNVSRTNVQTSFMYFASKAVWSRRKRHGDQLAAMGEVDGGRARAKRTESARGREAHYSRLIASRRTTQCHQLSPELYIKP
jgi:hypothetical protein